MTGFFNNIYPYTDLHELNLSFILEHFKEFMEQIDSLNNWRVEHEAEYEELKDLYDDILAGRFPEEMRDALEQWVIQNGTDLIGEMIKTVFFALNTDGYFVAFIPDSWSDIQFGTSGLDDFPAGVDYGHLTLTY